MIHVMIGTKAQFIKTAPVMKEMDRRGIEYNFIDSGQHAEITRELINLFDLKQPDVYLSDREKDIVNTRQAFFWNIKNILKFVVKRKEIFQNQRGICLVHGDAFSALQGTIIAKLAGVKVAHIEAGERTHNYFEPFPEEIVRILVDRYSDTLFASSDSAYNNLLKENIKGKKFNVRYNTIYDSVKIALQKDAAVTIPKEDYVVATIHRFETIFSKKNLKMVVETLEKISEDNVLLFLLHKPTRNKLESYGLMERLQKNKRILLSPLYDYFSFMKLIKNSTYIVTDGGGPQEESFYLNVPCLLLRKKTERSEHPNICLSGFKEEKIDYFIENYSDFKSNTSLDECSPSSKIVDVLEKFVEG